MLRTPSDENVPRKKVTFQEPQSPGINQAEANSSISNSSARSNKIISLKLIKPKKTLFS